MDKGIDDEEAKRLITSLSKLANKHIDLPYLPEMAEYMAIRLVIGVIVNAARKQWDLRRAKENMYKMKVPHQKYASQFQLESIIS
jgi:hypothetical protein